MEEKFGKYEVLGRLGEGAMGVVFKAQDPILKRTVAIKTISASLGGDDELRQRFEREAQAAASLNHPNIITIHDFGEEKGKIYMAMELLEGEDLKERIASGALQTLEDKLGVMEQICDGLTFAHAKGIVHRDLKPGNIHIQPNGQVKVLDFGLARLGTSDMTKTGIVMGTPNYMSPEQVMGEKVDARSDVFALGAVFYELLTNHKPFEADSVHAVLYQVVHKEPLPVRDWQEDVPGILVELVEKALSKDPAQRFPDASGMREALRHVRQALRSGQIDEASLADVLDVEMVDESDLGPVAARGRADSSSPRVTEGTVALDMTKPGARRTGRTLTGRSASQPPAQQQFTPRPIEPSKAPYWIAGGVVAAVVIAAGMFFALRQPQPASTPASDAASAQVGALTEALVQTQLDLARRVLADKDYQGAIDQAERALKLDPTNAPAKEIVDQARNTLFDLDAAATEARQAFDAGDTQRASEALSKVLSLDPKHPVAAELTAKLNRFFRSQAEDARAAMDRSRGSAESAGAASYDDFNKGGALSRQAGNQFQAQEYAVATQSFLQARDAYDRARRAAEADAQKRAADRAAAEKAAAERAAAEKAAAERAAAAKAAQAPPATAPRPAVTAPPQTAPVPTTAPPATAPPVTQPAVPAISLAPGDTRILGTTSGGPAGFDMSGVTLSDFKGQMEFDVQPTALRPGDRYKISIYLVNTGEVNVKLKSAETMTNVNGRRTRGTLRLLEDDVKKGKRTRIAEVEGTWEEGIETWSLDVSVTSDKGEKYRNRLALQ